MADGEDAEAVLISAGIGVFLLLTCVGFIDIMGDPRDVLVDRDLSGRAQTVPGIVLGIEDTYHEINEETVEVIGFKYTVDGKDYEGQSYTSEYSVLNALKVGGPVTVEYLPDAPHIGRVKGASASQVPWWTFLVLIPFILLGLLMLYWSASSIGQSIRGSQKTTEGTFVDASGQSVKAPWHEG
ncbi:MAG: DUF3592 domain-containing protein [Candidatus Undinarchaeales archaeon]|jgi:hypothetical protein|nr:DUF3592 domain-containing protein [Candidatus Undinarchaeales archaeon]MDP7494132.1 DUF3592 domain-containing protein [Candidatus Undinarchaeales archaeon]